MATNGEGDWPSCIKALITASYSSFNKNDIAILVNLIQKSKEEFEHHDLEYECFYFMFAALSAHYLAQCAGSLCKVSLPSVGSACHVLLNFMLQRMQKHTDTDVISQKQLMVLIHSLCKGTSSLPRADAVTFTNLLKASHQPQHVKVNEDIATADVKESVENRELKRPRLDTGKNIFTLMTSVFDDLPIGASRALLVSGNTETETNILHIADHNEEIRAMFVSRNMVSLQQLNASDILMKACLQLPTLQIHMKHYREALVHEGDFDMPATLQDAVTVRSCLQNLVNEVSVVCRMFSLPILEPITLERLHYIVDVALGCLHSAILATMAASIVSIAAGTQVKGAAGTKDEELDGYTASVVQRALEIMNCVENAIKISTRTGGQCLQNYNMIGSWLLLEGLQSFTALTQSGLFEKPPKDATAASGKGKPNIPAPGDSVGSPKGKDGGSSATKPPSAKSHAGFSVLWVALASRALSLMSSLMEDLQLESLALMATETASMQPANLIVDGSYTAAQRVHTLTSSVNVTNLLFSLLAITFKKAQSVRRMRLVGPSENTSDASDLSSDSNTYYEDDFSSSDDSSGDDDDDSEPILGQWFEETLSPGEPETSLPPPPPPPAAPNTQGGGKHGSRLGSADSPVFLPDKLKPDGFLELAADVIHFLNCHFLHTASPSIRNYLCTSLAEQHMVSLATVMRDLDHDNPRHDGSLVEEFSTALSKFIHSLLATGLLSDYLQDCLLGHLGVSLQCTGLWPLRVYPRTLATLAQVLLLRQQQEREGAEHSVKGTSEQAIIKIWTCFVETLQKAALEPGPTAQDCEDVNVEHLQLLLLLFHSLAIMQKKALLLQLAQSLIHIADSLCDRTDISLVNHHPLLVTRLLLIMDYLVHYLYDPPPQLMKQVQYNLFGADTGQKPDNLDDSLTQFHFLCREVEDNYVKHLSVQDKKECVMRPRFYNLAQADYNNQDLPKVDGLAISFLLSPADHLNYSQFHRACVTLLDVGSQLDHPFLGAAKPTFLDLCCVHYHYMVCWRLLGCLPPSTAYLRHLEADNDLNTAAELLYTLQWVPRFSNRTFQGWTKDCVVKQGLTTQQADSLLSTIVRVTDNVGYDIKTALVFLHLQLSMQQGLPNPLSAMEVVPPVGLPSLSTIYLLDVVIAKLQVTLDDLFTKSMSETDPHKMMIAAQDLLPAVFQLIEAYRVYVRSCVLSGHTTEGVTAGVRAYGAALSIGSNRALRTSALGACVMNCMPPSIRNAVEKWTSGSANEFPAVGSWRNAFANDAIPVEGYIDSILATHMGTLSGQQHFSLNSSLKHLLQALVRFCGDLVIWCPDEQSSKDTVQVLFPFLFDVTTEYLSDYVTLTLDRVLGPTDGDEFMRHTYDHAISTCHSILLNQSTASTSGSLDELILHECLGFMEGSLEKNPGKLALEKFYTHSADLTVVLLSAASDSLSPTYGTKVLQFFNKLFQLAEKMPSDSSYEALCKSFGKLANLDSTVLQTWLSKMIMGSSQNVEDGSKIQENRLLLQSLTSYIVKEKSHIGEEVAKSILFALVPMGSQILSPTSESIGFSDIMVVMATLAGAGSGSGHVALFQAAIGWLELCKTYLVQKNVLEKLQENVATGKHQTMLESACYLLTYIGDILSALKHSSDRHGATSPPYEGEYPLPEADSDWADELVAEEEDSMAEDSDEESLNHKLCTFTLTQRDYLNQHWYHCHTCKMVDSYGVCSVCAKVCHKDHDLSYAKYGSFFCDCGAKEDNSCQALVKRSAQSGLDTSVVHASCPSPFSMETMLTSSLRRRLSSPVPCDRQGFDTRKEAGKLNKVKDTLYKQIGDCCETIMSSMAHSNTAGIILVLLQAMMPAIVENYHQMSPLGSTHRAQKALNDLCTLPKTVETTDQLMTATLGSQEGAFENVRMNFSGDQGQTIRQLLTSHVVRRVAMCCLSSPQGRRQHLAVSHEKGKVTILQLAALLKQADSSKRKLTLTRLSSAPVPFTVLSIAGNPCNEDLLAVCGLKDCHVLTFNSAGAVSDHLVLHPTLDSGNFIIKALWLPGSQTELAIVTAEFVKIYDLSQDAISPQYFLLLPVDKIRDAALVFCDDGRHLLLMSAAGYVYAQSLDEASSARHGPFYITSFVDMKHPDVKEQNGLTCGGGVSLYYSHSLQLVFISFANGKSFAASISRSMDSLPCLFPIAFKSSNGGKGASPLVQWTEVPNHPGLICCMLQATNNPVVLMIKPDTILVQEIKIVPAKAKIQDMVAIRHSGTNTEQKTTLILLCEDGSLRIYMANIDHTNYWKASLLQPHEGFPVIKPAKKKKVVKTGHPAGGVTLPVDFFEHCQLSNDIEFGGNDVLQVYNTAQIKQRLNNTGMYIASTKPAGFTIEVNNTSATTVIVGVRVLVGTQAPERAPAYMEMFGRTVQMALTRNRWFDIPFTREESLAADRKFSMFFGASSDPAGVTMVDSIKIYTKTKEAFSWPEDVEDFSDANPAPVPTPKIPAVTPVATAGLLPTIEVDNSPHSPVSLTSIDRLLASSLEVLDGCFAARTHAEDKDPLKQNALELTTQLLSLPTPPRVQQQTNTLLSDLFPSRLAYHSHKDHALLAHVMKCLRCSQQGKELDADAFQTLVLTARSVAVSRPSNLIRFAERDLMAATAPNTSLVVTDLESDDVAKELGSMDAISSASYLQLDAKDHSHFTVQLLEAFWKLHTARPANPMIAPVCLPGLTRMEAVTGALVEIIHAFTTCELDTLPLAAKLYMRMLLSEDTSVSFACKQALIRVLRPRQRRKRVYIPSPPHCSTPGSGEQDDYEEDDESKPKTSATPQTSSGSETAGGAHNAVMQPHQVSEVEPHFEIVEPAEPLVMEPADGDQVHEHGTSAIEALLAGGAHFPAMLDIPPDADDETMVELAIALSLQDQSLQDGSGLGLQGFNLGAASQGGLLEAGHLSDTTASAPGSDDEGGSTAAMDGSALRTSPADDGGRGSAAGSESGASNGDSVSVSGRSSAYGDATGENSAGGGRNESGALAAAGLAAQDCDVGSDHGADQDCSHALHTVRLLLLEQLISYMPHVRDVGGVRAIPYMQVLLMLSSDFDAEEEKDRAGLDTLLTALMGELNLSQHTTVAAMANRTPNHEVQLVIMRLLSVLMSRTKAGNKSPQEASGSTFLSSSTDAALLQSGGLDYCLSVLQALLAFWKQAPSEEEGSTMPGQLLKPHHGSSPPDMSPFFLRQYVKSHANDVFEDYPRLLTEMVLRLPYQMKKIAETSESGVQQFPTFDQTWHHVLAEYLMTQQAPFVRRQVRKLLLYVCGSKDKYRQLRDMHTLETNMREVRALCLKGGLGDSTDAEVEVMQPISLPYDVLILLMEHLKTCSDVASSRTINWQRFCQKDHSVLAFLVEASIMVNEAVAPVLLQLLQCALCGLRVPSAHTSPIKGRKDKDKEEEGVKYDEALCNNLVQHVCRNVSRELLIKFVRCFLLESNSTAVRWQAHALVLHIYRSSSSQQQESLLDLMWIVWPELPAYGRKAAQFVDLLGYFALKTIHTSEQKMRLYVEKAVGLLRRQNKILGTHSNGSIYNMLQGLVDFDGFYLESDPCLVCNNPEVSYANLKLSSIKVDSKFTTTTQIVKLVGSHTISKIVCRISDLKRTKMVRSLNVYYNNRSVQAVVELKNKPGLWHKAKKVVLTSAQSEVKVDFPLPIVACNLMIEYADFYDNIQASVETLQCPRCSATVPANPGVCGNCGENVFQCHKCRAINYDEKDPFLCNACGFCKYAKFDFTLLARPCCAVDPIENDDDRKKAVATINSLLEKADRLYKQLQVNKPTLEALLVRVSEHTVDKTQRQLKLLAAKSGSSSGGCHMAMLAENITTCAVNAGLDTKACALVLDKQEEASVGGSGRESSGGGASSVNRCIFQLAQRYCGDCHNTFDELSKIIQRVLASRKELVEYDKLQREAALAAVAALPGSTPTTPTVSPRTSEMFHAKEIIGWNAKSKDKLSRCYGCASATVEHCITLLRALSTNAGLKHYLCSLGVVHELVGYNLRRGTPTIRNDVRHLVCQLTKDNITATNALNYVLASRVTAAIKAHLYTSDFAASVHHEVLLLASTLQREDSCWEARVRCVMELFLSAIRVRSPAVLETVALPCLRMLHLVIKPPNPMSKKNKEKSLENLSTVKANHCSLHVDSKAWLEHKIKADFTTWKGIVPAKALEFESKRKWEEKSHDHELEHRITHVKYLMEKFGGHWLNTVRTRRGRDLPLQLAEKTWLRQAMFSPSSMAARQTACNIIEAMCQIPARKKHIIDMLTSYLEDVGDSGEAAAEFLALYKRLISTDQWKHYLAVKGVLYRIGVYITKEIDALTVLEETTLNSDLSQGYALKALTELLATFVEQDNIKQHYKSRLVGTVLNGYLSLKKLIVQRTKLTDETQDKLLDLLEEMTTGTESETKEFMAVCVKTIENYSLQDFLSPVFIFERLCSIIYPEENDVGEYFLTLEKDPQQEDFLQGRMLGNPYSSTEPGLGPLMRDVKNKICQDCELVALLEDDTGMELLVCNKIISLDLAVKDVFRKIWVPEHGEGEAMRVVYRMRGLLGDATEDMVNSLDCGKDEDVNEEEVYKMATVMSQCGGLQVMLQRLAAISDVVTGKQLLQVLLKLFSFCVKVKINRQLLTRPEMNTISIMLGALNLALLVEQEVGASNKGQTLTEQLLQIMEIILQEASQQPLDAYSEFSKLCGDKDQLMILLDRINSLFVRQNTNVLEGLMRLIPFLAFGDTDKMLTLVNHFKPYMDFNKYDFEHSDDEQIHLECFCVIAQGIEQNANGTRLKDLLLERHVVHDCMEYIQMHAPEIKTMLPTDSDNWKEFLSKPVLPYALRLLTGLSRGHDPTQALIGEEVIPILHKLEQVSSDEHIGTLAENLMETLRGHPQVAPKVEEVRQQTRAEKKRLAMAMRKKQLGALGMTTNEKGQVTVSADKLKQVEELKEETGLICCICREGYRYQPKKVLAVYTFTKRVNTEDFELKPRKTHGYSTVSHFNVVHVDCHLAAVRHARGREEWDSAALQNANTRCNGLLPLWGPQVPESAFASCLARHNTYLQQCTGVPDASYSLTVQDMKHLLLRFCHDKSFSEDSGGGGRESNMYLLPHMVHMALYVMNTTRCVPREEKNLFNFTKAPPEKWVESSYEVDGPLYWMVMALHVYDQDKWCGVRGLMLRRLLILAHARSVSPGGTTSLLEKEPKEYSIYKPHLIFFAIVDGIINTIFKKCTIGEHGIWSTALAEFIRNNDQSLLEECRSHLTMVEEEVRPCDSFSEYIDVMGLYDDVTEPDTFIAETLAMLP